MRRAACIAAAAVAATCLAAPATVGAHDGEGGELEGAQSFSMARFGAVGLARAAMAEPAPLTGEGENMELVANVPIDPGPQGVAASDLELHGNHAFVGSYGEGVVIVDIADPRNPRRVGKFHCPGGQNDVQLSPDGRYAAMAIETSSNGCHEGKQGTVILDVSDRANPVEIAFIPIVDRLGQPEGAHNNLLNWPYLYVAQYQVDYSKLEIFDLTDPSAPRKAGELDFGGKTSSHDLIVDHRPDGRSLAYSASVTGTDVIDVTDPSRPRALQRITDPAVSISHQAEPNHDRTMLVVTDEFGGGAGLPACGKAGTSTLGEPGAAPPPVSDPADLGALHIYALADDGTVAGTNGQPKLGTFNIPAQPNDPLAGCTIHVFWQAPDQDRLVTAWYGRGTRIVDFSDPARPRQLGWYIPTQADTWSAKPHNGYIYAGDIVRGLDVLRYTGDDGWPANAGPAEVQRAEEQGVPQPAP